MGVSRQEYWSGLLCPPPEELPDPGIKPVSLISPALAGGFFTHTPREAHELVYSALFWKLTVMPEKSTHMSRSPLGFHPHGASLDAMGDLLERVSWKGCPGGLHRIQAQVRLLEFSLQLSVLEQSILLVTGLCHPARG